MKLLISVISAMLVASLSQAQVRHDRADCDSMSNVMGTDALSASCSKQGADAKFSSGTNNYLQAQSDFSAKGAAIMMANQNDYNAIVSYLNSASNYLQSANNYKSAAENNKRNADTFANYGYEDYLSGDWDDAYDFFQYADLEYQAEDAAANNEYDKANSGQKAADSAQAILDEYP